MTLIRSLIVDMRDFPHEWEYKSGSFVNKTLGISVNVAGTFLRCHVTIPMVFKFGFINRLRLKLAYRRWARRKLKAILNDQESN